MPQIRSRAKQVTPFSFDKDIFRDILSPLNPTKRTAIDETTVGKQVPQANGKKKRRVSVIQQALYTAPDATRRKSIKGIVLNTANRIQSSKHGNRKGLQRQEIENMRLKIDYTEQLLQELLEEEQKEIEEKYTNARFNNLEWIFT